MEPTLHCAGRAKTEQLGDLLLGVAVQGQGQGFSLVGEARPNTSPTRELPTAIAAGVDIQVRILGVGVLACLNIPF